MSVHESLRTLVTRYGDRVLETADDLRATLDDFLEEGQATPGEINLLVDAVRLGAYHQMLSMLTHGADPRAAVEGSGARLAEDRGGDHRSASWACAALGYAVGRVPESLVLAYRSGQQPGPGGAAAPAATPPVGAPPTEAPPYGINPSATAPAAGPQPTPAQLYGPSGGPAPTQAPGGSWAGPPQQPAGGGNRTALIAGVGAALAVVAVVGVVAVAASGDDEDTPGDDPTTPEVTETTFDPAYAVADLRSDFAALGSQVDDGADSCERSEPQEGQTELVRCTYSQLEVVFTTYANQAALEDARSGIEDEVSAQEHELESEEIGDAGEFRLVSDSTLDLTWMYWDSTESLQSAYVSDTIADLPSRAANTFFDQRGETDATRAFPEPVAPFESAALWETAQDYVGDQVRGSAVNNCETSKLYGGDVEAITCTDGDYTLFFYVREDMEALQEDRDKVADGAVSDTTWNWFGDSASGNDYPTSGRLVKTRVTPEEGGNEQAVVYWDDEALLVNAYIYGPDRDMRPVVDYWAAGE